MAKVFVYNLNSRFVLVYKLIYISITTKTVGFKFGSVDTIYIFINFKKSDPLIFILNKTST